MGQYLPNLVNLMFEHYCRTHDIPLLDSNGPDILYELAYPISDPVYPPRGAHPSPEPPPDATQAERERLRAENAALKAETGKKQRRRGTGDTTPRRSRRG